MPLEDAPLATALIDLLRLTHLGAAAAGIGAMMATDLTMLRLADTPVGPRHWRAIEAAHLLIGPALAIAWITGLVLAAVVTGLDPAAVTPKLAMKLAVVALLSLDAAYMAFRIQPLLGEVGGYGLHELPLRWRLELALAAGLSVAGWSSALVLGASEVMKSADWQTLIALVGTIHLAVLAGALAVALRAPRIVRLWRMRHGRA